MNNDKLVAEVLEATPRTVSGTAKTLSVVFMALGLAGLGIAFGMGPAGSGWTAVLVAGVMLIGLAVAGVVFSAIFQITAAIWGRPYRRLAEAGIVLMPVGLLLIVAYLAGAGDYIPWTHAEHLSGGKHIWLTRGFWDARIMVSLLALYAFSLAFVYYSLRKDFCIPQVRSRFTGALSRWLGKGIENDAAEGRRCETRLTYMAPPLAIVYAFVMSYLAFDLIMALEPDWYSTLFGAWYFISHLFVGAGLIVTISLYYKAHVPLERFLTDLKQRDIATIVFAFCFLTTSFFWDQFLTIWYGNLPEETHYFMNRSEGSLGSLVIIGLVMFFLLPFVGLIFRKVKHSRILISSVSVIALLGILVMRFLEIAPPTMGLNPAAASGVIMPALAGSLLVLLGGLGTGVWLYAALLTKVPIMPVGDDIFVNEYSQGEAQE